MIAHVQLNILAHVISANPFIKLYTNRIADLELGTPEFVTLQDKFFEVERR